jgi:transposase
MPRPLSSDLRKRIIEAKQRGDTEDKIAAEKGVSKSTVTKLWAFVPRDSKLLASPQS